MIKYVSLPSNQHIRMISEESCDMKIGVIEGLNYIEDIFSRKLFFFP